MISVVNTPSFYVHTAISVRIVHRHDFCGKYAFLLHRLHTAASVRTVHRHDVCGLYTFLVRTHKEDTAQQFTGLPPAVNNCLLHTDVSEVSVTAALGDSSHRKCSHLKPKTTNK